MTYEPSADAQSVVREMEASHSYQSRALRSEGTESLVYATLSQAAATRALVKVSLFAIQNSISIASEAIRDHNSQA